ncbi:MAG: hypothetical protein MJE77_16270 [Proteobacteria bacterium]|nr:hypothetical protein [Pseudomonadota bacterium]
MSERDNHCRYRGQMGHYEVWYITTNHSASQTGYWIRYTLESPLPGRGEPYAQLWFASFDARDPGRNVAINRKLPISSLRDQTDPFAIALDGSEFDNQSARGSLRGGGHEASWDLSWTPADRTHHHLPAVMYRRDGLGETTVLSPNLNVALSGTITCDGRTVELDGESGGQTHLWGQKHAHSWAWGHCNGFDAVSGDRPTDRPAFEILSVQLKRAGHLSPQLTIFALYLDGKIYRFNDFRHTLVTRARYRGSRFWFSGSGLRTRIEGEFSCRPADMVVATYVDPDGELSYCANTEVADLRLAVYKRRGVNRWIEHTRLLSRHRAHFEIGGRERDPAVAANHVTLD